MLRDSVVDLKAVIQNLQTQVSDLLVQSQVRRLETKLESGAVDPANVQRPPTEVIHAIQENVEHAETAETTAEINIRENDFNETRNTVCNNFRLQAHRINKLYCFTGVSEQYTSKIRSVSIGNAGCNTSIPLWFLHRSKI